MVERNRNDSKVKHLTHVKEKYREREIDRERERERERERKIDR